jgi:hypothetical protein
METELVYISKDGRKFDDPFKCEEYERFLGKEPGKVGHAKEALRSIGMGQYLNGYLAVHHDGQNYWRHFITTCLDEYLENYVNVNELLEEKRWMTATVADAVRMLEEFDDSDECIYLLTCCRQRDFKGPFGATSQQNNNFWDKTQKKKESSTGHEVT